MDRPRSLVFPPKRILVALDLSHASVLAWRQAKAMAAAFGATVDGLYVQEWLYSAMGGGFASPSLPPAEPREIAAELRRKLGAGEEIGVAIGPVEHTIVSWGKHLGYDLIVMGTHGRRGLQRLILGSVAETVLRYATVPVLVVRGAPVDFRSILAPVVFEPYGLAGLRSAAEIASAMAAQLTVLHVVSSPVYAGASLKGPKHLLADAVNRLPADIRAVCKPKTKVALGRPDEQIAAAARETDLIILVAHSKGFLNDKVLGTTVERLLRHSDKPLLALPTGVSPQPKKKLAASSKEAS